MIEGGNSSNNNKWRLCKHEQITQNSSCHSDTDIDRHFHPLTAQASAVRRVKQSGCFLPWIDLIFEKTGEQDFQVL